MSQEQSTIRVWFWTTFCAVVVLALAAFLAGWIGLAHALAWFGGAGVFALTYWMFTKVVAGNYRSEGQRPTATWPSDVPPAP